MNENALQLSAEIAEALQNTLHRVRPPTSSDDRTWTDEMDAALSHVASLDLAEDRIAFCIIKQLFLNG
jgi:hypothetical protein